MRIVSLVPSLSHLLCDLGLKGQVVGCTNFCVLPADLLRQATVVGGTKDPDLTKIAALQPTHILVNEEENKPEHIAACRAIAPTLLTFPKGPADVASMLRDVETFLGLKDMAKALRDGLAREMSQVTSGTQAAGSKAGQRFLYFIWREPYMLAGRDTYISRMLGLLGMVNAYEGEERYPVCHVDAMRAMRADQIFLSSEPYPFRRRDAVRLRAEWPGAPAISKIDGQLMSWYGSMTLAALVALRRWENGGGEGLVTPFAEGTGR